jgi:hypothetical protein
MIILHPSSEEYLEQEISWKHKEFVILISTKQSILNRYHMSEHESSFSHPNTSRRELIFVSSSFHDHDDNLSFDLGDSVFAHHQHVISNGLFDFTSQST